MIPYRSIRQWCHQGDRDQFGLCFWAMEGNALALETGEPMPLVEIESSARAMEGFSQYDPSTDHGERLEDGFSYLARNGWPGDPARVITSWRKIRFEDVAATIAELGCVRAWLNLPMTADGEDYDFTDDALARGAEGVHPHAVLIVDAADGVTFPTWGEPQTVSEAWARRYFQGFYRVEWGTMA